MEEEMKNNSFTYNPQYLVALEDLDEEDQWRATYVLCYYGVHGEFPSCATAIDKMFVKTNLKMIAGSISWQGKQNDKAKKGGKVAAISDEQIIGAYIELYKKNGKRASEKEVIDYCGGGISRIATRAVWKNRDKYLYDCMNEKDTIHTNVCMDTYKHTNQTYKSTEENCMVQSKEETYNAFDF